MRNDSVDELIALGFEAIGDWKLKSGRPTLVYRENSEVIRQARPALYAHAVEGIIRYIGKTAQKLEKRLNGYEKPGAAQSTNVKCHANIVEALQKKQSVRTLAWVPQTQLSFCGLSINLAAGLEDSLIYKFDPCWNGTGKGRKRFAYSESTDHEQYALNLPDKPEVDADPVQETVAIKLGKSYYHKGFINFPAQKSHLLGNDGDRLLIEFANERHSYFSNINRKANPKTLAVRVYGGAELKRWFQQYFELHNTVNVSILDAHRIRFEG